MSEIKRLKDVCICITDGSHYSPPATEETTGYPMLSVKDMGSYDFDFSNCKMIDKDEYDKMVRNGCVPLVNDVVIAKDGSYLKEVFVITEEREIAILSSIGILRPDTKQIDPYYLKYYLTSDHVKYEVGRKYVTGSALPRIILDNFGQIEIPLISIENQRYIVSLLKDIDFKISNNTTICSDLESMAKLLYDYWFVQFDFPDENGKPYKSSGGKMVWNEELKREIPKGWEVKTIGSLLGNYPKTSSVLRNDYTKGSKYPIIDQSKDYICGYTDEEEKVIHTDNIIVFGDHTNITKYVNFDFARGADGTQIINSNDVRLPNYILYLQICSLPIIEKGYSRHFKFLKNQRVVIPIQIIAEKYMNILNPTLFEKRRLIEENQQLASLRDFLLPMLMNGQVKVGKKSI